MNASLKQRTVNGLFWSVIDSFAGPGVYFVIGLILARLLSPREFGLIGMITIFIAVSQAFTDSGFSQALIRKQNCTQADYSTVFYFNVLIGIIVYLVLFFAAGTIGNLFGEPQLKQLLRVLGICLIIDAFSIIQRTQLIKKIDFKLQTLISIIASLSSGVIGITMALRGYGVWSLVWSQITMFALASMLLWLWNGWKPSPVFNKKSFKEMFSFGSKLLVSGLIDTAYQNIYYFIIGKYFSAAELGYYTRADQFKKLPSERITSVIQRVSYPALSSIQDNKEALKAAYKKLIKGTMLLSFIFMMGMAAIAEPLVVTLVGAKWLPCVIYLQLLCFVGMFYPLHALNLNLLKVLGRSDLFLRLEIIKKCMAIPVIFVGIFYGIKIMIGCMIVNTLIAYILNSYWSGRFIGYPTLEQIKDIMPSFLLAASLGIIVFSAGHLVNAPPFVILIVQIFIGILFSLCVAEGFKMEDYLYLKRTLMGNILGRMTH